MLKIIVKPNQYNKKHIPIYLHKSTSSYPRSIDSRYWSYPILIVPQNTAPMTRVIYVVTVVARVSS